MEWMMDFVSKFYRVGRQVLDTCAAPLATANVCLQLFEYHRHNGCEKDSALFLDALPSLVEV